MKRIAGVLLLIAVAVTAGYFVGHSRGARSKPATSDAILYYIDPMHPSYRSDKPGIAPDCGMELVPVYAKDVERSLVNAGLNWPSAETDSATQQLYGISVSKVQATTGRTTIRFFGRVAADETRIYHVNVSTSGFVKKTQNDAVGNHVKKDQLLALVYSAEVLYAAAGYLSGTERVPGATMKDSAPQPQTRASISTQPDYLRNLGMSDTQINQIKTTHKIPDDVDVLSPADGFILTRTISPGQRFEKNAEFYTIADLSHVWVFPEVFGDDARAFHAGILARVTVPSTGETFTARVSDALPQINSETGALRPRLEVDNPHYRLIPNMYVSIELSVAVPSGVTVPVDAVLDSGISKRVFVQTAPGRFEAREVKVGWRQNGRVLIVSGLREGETVASTGTFLIDSESRLRAAPNGGAITGSLVKTGVERHVD